jgi:hypothetical protein
VWYLIILGSFIIAMVIIALRTKQVWPIGTAMLEIAGVLIYLLFALWPVRYSDVPASQVQACAVQNSVSAPGGGAIPQPTGSQKPTPTPTATVTPAATPVPTASPAAVPSAGPAGTTTEQQNAARVSVQAQIADPWLRCANIFGYELGFPFETRLLIIVSLAAALGAFVHVATSFSDYLGAGTYDARWLWYYVLRIPVGVSLANVFYFAIRGGILTTTSPSTTDVNPFGLAAIAGLVGLFSKQASDKLQEVFETLFKTAAADAARAGSAIAPTIISTTPKKIVRSSAPKPLDVFGANFQENMKAEIDGREQRPDRKDDRNLTIPLVAADVVAPKKKVTVTLTNRVPQTSTAPARSASFAYDVEIEEPSPPPQGAQPVQPAPPAPPAPRVQPPPVQPAPVQPPNP